MGSVGWHAFAAPLQRQGTLHRHGESMGSPRSLTRSQRTRPAAAVGPSPSAPVSSSYRNRALNRPSPLASPPSRVARDYYERYDKSLRLKGHEKGATTPNPERAMSSSGNLIRRGLFLAAKLLTGLAFGTLLITY